MGQKKRSNNRKALRTTAVQMTDKKQKSKPRTRAVQRKPKTAVVAITCTSEGVSYSEALKQARSAISLQELGIQESNAQLLGVYSSRYRVRMQTTKQEN